MIIDIKPSVCSLMLASYIQSVKDVSNIKLLKVKNGVFDVTPWCDTTSLHFRLCIPPPVHSRDNTGIPFYIYYVMGVGGR